MDFKWLLFSTSRLYVGYVRHAITTRWLANPNRGKHTFSHNLWSSCEHLIHYQGEDFCAQINPSIMLIFELRMVIIFLARSLIFSKHMSYWYMLLEPHLTAYHSNIGV
jgi:hypothetical protein